MSQAFYYPSISVSAPVGGATSANQVLEIALLTSIDGKTPTLGQKTMANSSPVVIASDQSAISVLGPLTDAQLRASPVPVSAAALPLPTGASTLAAQTDGSQKSQVVDGAGNVWGPRTSSGGVNYFPVINLEAASPGAAIAARTLQVGGSDGVNLRTLSTDAAGALNVLGPLTDTQLRASPVPISGTVTANAGTGTFAISAASLPLPTGASTSALQTTGNASLASIDGKLNSLGQKTMANSVPVVIASDQSAVSSKAATPTAGTLSQAAATVGTTAVRCTVSGAAPSASRKELVVEPDPTSTAKFYIGSSSVTSSGANRGIQLAPGAQFIADYDAGDYYIISDTAAQTFFVMEQV